MHRNTTVPAQGDFLSGGGEMGELIRTMDWSENSLGAPAQWPQSLQTSVSICLNSRFPMLIWWGNDLVKIYNDSYSKLIAAKHPKAMGSKGADVWPEIWAIVGPLLQSVVETGNATWSEDQLLINERNGYPEECYFTFSYSAIRDESGGVGGVFCAVNETTQKVLAEKQLVKQFSDLFVKAPVSICILRGENYVIEVINERMAEMWDRKIDAVKNRPVSDVLPELKEQGFKELLDTVYFKGERFVTEELPVNLIRNGKSDNAFLKFVYEPLREDDGSISGVMALAHEITEQVNDRKRIEESEAFNRTVLESSPDCLKVIDGEGRLVFMNSNGLCALEIEDFTSIENKAWWDIWSADNKAMVKAAIAKALGGEQAYFQAKDYTFKGTLKWWDVIVYPVMKENAAKISNIIAVSRDITREKLDAIKLQESELRYSNFIASSSSLIVILKGEDLLIEVANMAMLQNLGKGKDIIGKPLLEVLPQIKDNDLGKLLRKVYETGEPHYGYEYPLYINRNGIRELCYYTFVFQAQNNLYGVIEGLAVIANEVTPQATLNLAVKESEERFRSLADNIPMFTYLIEPNEDATISYWNKTWLDYTGQTEEEALGRGWYGIVHPDDIPGVMEIYLYALKKGIPYYLPAIRIKRFDGKYRWHMIKSNPRYLPNGTFMGFIGVGFDIHESKLAAASLKESEERLRNLVEKAPSPICIFKGENMVLVVANEPVFKTWNVGKEALGKAFLDIIPEMKDQPFMGWLLDVYHNGVTHYGNEEPAYFTRKNGDKETIYYNFVYQPYREDDGSISGVMVLATDITMQVVARKKMEAQAGMVSNLLLTAPAFICTLTGTDHVYDLVNERYQQLFGKRKIQGKAIMKALPELEGQGLDTLLDNVYNTGETYVGIDVPFMLARDENLEPEIRYFNFSYQPMYNDEKAIYAILVFGYEVTEQMLAKKQIEESERHFRKMTDLMPVKVTNATADGAVTFYNKTWLEFSGMSFEELQQFGYHKMMHPDEIEEFKKLLGVAAEAGTDLEMEMRFMNKEGEYKWHLNLASPVKDEYGKIKMWIGVTTEIEKIKEEERLKNNFLSMASHELKTPLTTIKAYGQIAARMLQHNGDTETLGIVNRMGKQIDKLNNLFSDLLDFTKLKRGKLIYHEAFFNFNELVQEIIEDMQSTSSTHTIESSFGQNAAIYGDKDKLGQVLNNLISNAIKYSPSAVKILVSSVSDESGVKLMVRDFGIGILPDEEDKVFEEFYRVSGDNQSTYPGMGIGLYISTEIVKNFNGRLWVESTGEAGSVFSLFIPCDYRQLTTSGT